MNDIFSHLPMMNPGQHPPGLPTPAQTLLTDAAGTVHVPDPAARIVSLVPSVTELLCDLGLTRQLVGRTGFCIHPAAAVAGIPKVGGTKDVNIEKIRRLQPSHVVVNIDENTLPVAQALAAFVPHVVVTHPRAPQDNLALAQLMGAIFCRQDAAQHWCERFARAYAALRAAPPGPRRTVLYCIWQDPWMTISADTYIARMLGELHWQLPQLADPARYPAFTWDAAVLEQVDAVLLSSEPYHFTAAHAQALTSQIGKPVLLVDGELLSWYGSRALAGVAYLGQLRAALDNRLG